MAGFELSTEAWMYDLYARMFAMGSSFETLPDCIRALEGLTDTYVEAGMKHPGGLSTRTLRTELTVRLKQRQFHWIAKCHQVATAVAKLSSVDSGAAKSEPQPPPVPSQSEPRPVQQLPSNREQPRRALIDEYIREVFARTGKRLTRTDFWKKAGYSSRTEFERWERNDPKATQAASIAFERVLRERPHLK